MINMPPVKKPPAQPTSYVGRGNGKPKTTLLWILEYLKCKYPDDKDSINALIEVTMKEL